MALAGSAVARGTLGILDRCSRHRDRAAAVGDEVKTLVFMRVLAQYTILVDS